jgi:NADPH2:quinone reductase
MSTDFAACIRSCQTAIGVRYACAPPGSYATVRTMRTDLLVRLPDFVTDEVAASLLLKGITAGFLLYDVSAVKRGDVILVHAAARAALASFCGAG